MHVLWNLDIAERFVRCQVEGRVWQTPQWETWLETWGPVDAPLIDFIFGRRNSVFSMILAFSGLGWLLRWTRHFDMREVSYNICLQDGDGMHILLLGKLDATISLGGDRDRFCASFRIYELLTPKASSLEWGWGRKEKVSWRWESFGHSDETHQSKPSDLVHQNSYSSTSFSDDHHSASTSSTLSFPTACKSWTGRCALAVTSSNGVRRCLIWVQMTTLVSVSCAPRSPFAGSSSIKSHYSRWL